MSTQHDSIWVALAERFEDWEVKEKKEKSTNGETKTLHYVDGSTVQNRLDDVLGPQNWWAHYTALGDAFVCHLTIRLPDGETITKEAVGSFIITSGRAALADPSNAYAYRVKAAQTDALKRAAVTFGVGRYLGKSGVPRFIREALDARREAPAPPSAPAKPRPPATPANASNKRVDPPAPAPPAPSASEKSPGRLLYEWLNAHGKDVGMGATLFRQVLSDGKEAGYDANMTLWTALECELARQSAERIVEDFKAGVYA